ncbi:hypothetical protein Bca4012_033784 [Brassica carinata]
MRGGLGTVEGNLDFGILRRTQGIERIRVMMGDQSLWILSDLVEIGNSGIHLLDLGGIGQLVGKGGDMVSGEMARKRLKIPVPHFDNSDLIKSYDMTLVGRLEGVPLELWSTETFQSIGDAIGATTDVDLNFGKMRVVLDSTKELCFETEVDFKGGEFYEEEEDHCPLNPRSPSKKKETKEIEERKEERARSYKGVVINGDGGKQETYKDHREYYGKGKGKMYEEPESKWVKVPERGSKRPSSYRANARGEEERSRPRNPHWEQSRYPMQEDRNRYQRGVRREQEGPKEEGEITVTERRQRNLHKVENIGEKAVPVEPSVTAMDLEGEVGDRAEIENLVTGLEQAMDLVGVGVGKGVADSEPLEFDGTVTLADHKEELLGGDDEFQALTDGEVEETNKLDEVTRGGAEGEEEIGGNGGTYDQMGEEARKKGARKVLFKKPPGISVGTSKMRLVQAVLSPRKTGVSKSTKRQGGGEGAKHTEEKGPSHPKNPKKPDV